MVIPRELARSARLRRDYTRTPQFTKAYLLGILHDASVRKTTYRIATQSRSFAEAIQKGIIYLGKKAWIYKEGRDRNLWIVEFSKNLLKDFEVRTRSDKLFYIRGFFDAEGGIAKSPKVRFYLYLCQKNKECLLQVKRYLTDLEIKSGKIHNPSRKIDPNYWRFYIRAESYRDFAKIISSNHPDKLSLLRMKI